MLYSSELVLTNTQSTISIYKGYQSHIQDNLSHIFHDLLSWLKQPLTQGKIFNNLYVFWDWRQKNRQYFAEMDVVERQRLLQKIRTDYSQILINYFTADKTIKDKIDKFVNLAFCARIPVPQIIEIHMELIEEFSKQLKLEGRSDEALLDYRLTLIDILAHLCEAYRCAMPK